MPEPCTEEHCQPGKCKMVDLAQDAKYREDAGRKTKTYFDAEKELRAFLEEDCPCIHCVTARGMVADLAALGLAVATGYGAACASRDDLQEAFARLERACQAHGDLAYRLVQLGQGLKQRGREAKASCEGSA